MLPSSEDGYSDGQRGVPSIVKSGTPDYNKAYAQGGKDAAIKGMVDHINSMGSSTPYDPTSSYSTNSNFSTVPEKKTPFGIVFFWICVTGVVVGLIAFFGNINGKWAFEHAFGNALGAGILGFLVTVVLLTVLFLYDRWSLP